MVFNKYIYFTISLAVGYFFVYKHNDTNMTGHLLVNKALIEAKFLDLPVLKEILELKLGSSSNDFIRDISIKYNLSKRDSELVVRYLTYKLSKKNASTSPMRIITEDKSTNVNLDAQDYGSLGSSEMTPITSNRLDDMMIDSDVFLEIARISGIE